MFIWEPHGCRPSLQRDESQLPQPEQLNDDGMWMVDSLGTHARAPAPFSRHIEQPGQHKGSSAALWKTEATLSAYISW